MSRTVLPLVLFVSMVFLFGSCSQEEVGKENSNGTPAEILKVEKITNLFKAYNWELDTTISVKERNELILKMDYDKVKSFLESLNKGVKFEMKDSLRSKTSRAKNRNMTTARAGYIPYDITGVHHNALTNSNTISRIYMKYYWTTTEEVEITGSTISSNYSGMTWTPSSSNPTKFPFSGKRCDISLLGTITYKPFYKGEQTMAGYVTKNYRGYIDDGKITRLH